MILKIAAIAKKSLYFIIALIVLIFLLAVLSNKLFVKKLTMSCKGIESQIFTNKKDEVSSNKNEKIISLTISLYNYPFLNPDATIDSGWGDYYFKAKDESRNVDVFPHSLIAHSKYNDGRYTFFNLDRISRKVFMEKRYDIRDDEKITASSKAAYFNYTHEIFEGVCEERKLL